MILSESNVLGLWNSETVKLTLTLLVAANCFSQLFGIGTAAAAIGCCVFDRSGMRVAVAVMAVVVWRE